MKVTGRKPLPKQSVIGVFSGFLKRVLFDLHFLPTQKKHHYWMR